LASIGYGQELPHEEPKWLDLAYLPEGGFYGDSTVVELAAPDSEIYFTLDGSFPTRSKKYRYQQPILLTKTTVIRAVAYQGDKQSKILAQTYFINEPPTDLPMVSIAVSPEVLFDPDVGLYMKGPGANDTLWTKQGANFWSRREVKVNTEIFEKDSVCVFNSITGFRLFGGISRLFPQKSMTLVARDRYGKKRLKHKVFGKKSPKKYKFIVLRNSGSDWGKSHFRDGLMTQLLNKWDIEKQDYRPSHVYINGRYWGIYNIREKVNRYFINTYHDIDKDSIDLLEHKYSVKRGSRKKYIDLIKYIRDHDLSDPANMAYLSTLMDIENFMDYQIAQIYYDNRDAGGNIKFWRPQRPNGRWRWILYDTDWGFGLHDKHGYRFNSLAFHTEPDGPDWPNPPWSTFILRHLLENEEFRQDFVNRFCDHINTTWTTERVIKKIDKLSGKLDPEIDRHFDRWRLSRKTWTRQLDIMKTFAEKRPKYMRKHLREYFDAGASAILMASTAPGGKLIVNENIRIKKDTLYGKYFENVPVRLKAIPNFGYKFSHWEGIAEGNELNELTLSLKAGEVNQVRPVFKQYLHPLAEQIIINEISPYDAETGDWIEIYNNSAKPVNLNRWIVADKKREYRLPDVTLPSKEHLVVCADTASFRQVFPEVKSIVGNIPFGLHKRKEQVSLYTSDGASIDSVFYEIEPRDTAYTISLLLPSLKNQDLENWEILTGHGTPMVANPYYVQSKILAEQELWMRVGVGSGVFICALLVLTMRGYWRRKQEIVVQPAPVASQDPLSNKPSE